MNPLRQHLMVFAKVPVAGRVKTRMIADVGAQRACQIYSRLLCHSLSIARQIQSESISCSLWLDQLSSIDAELENIAIRRQQGVDLGLRMQAAFSSQLKDYQNLILIGSDSPDYTVEYIQNAFQALKHHDLVLGPAADGGYLLLGMKQLHAELFELIPWGTNQVLSITRQRIRQSGLSCHEMPDKRDVDLIADLAHFPGFADDLI